ncbi:MAG TPA: DUF502 domain-containing protein [bacterium]|nr:DUF502 domain-containing protein [bacterium]
MIVPAALSLWVLWKIFVFLESLIGQWIQKAIPQFYVRGLGFVSLIAIILILGFFAQNIFGRRIIRYLEKGFLSIPVFNKLYQFVHSILQQLFRKEKEIFHGVALVQLSNDVSTIGFITSKEPVVSGLNNDYWTVFIPTVPNPTSGFVLFVHKDNLKPLPIGVEQGMKILLSFGIYKISDAANQNKSTDSQKN